MVAVFVAGGRAQARCHSTGVAARRHRRSRQIRPSVRTETGGGGVIKTADRIIDLGPKGGDEILAAATPEDMILGKAGRTVQRPCRHFNLASPCLLRLP